MGYLYDLLANIRQGLNRLIVINELAYGGAGF
jgi:hypothetical protein